MPLATSLANPLIDNLIAERRPDRSKAAVNLGTSHQQAIALALNLDDAQFAGGPPIIGLIDDAAPVGRPGQRGRAVRAGK
jgi:hypothetical protein